MKHTYELRQLKTDNSVVIVMSIKDEPKNAKLKARDYAEKNPGLYTLKMVEDVSYYFTEKE